ncbi:hypothetical protein J7643_02065 [bacterium]|nr:hypothetical protein [bacterium]
MLNLMPRASFYAPVAERPQEDDLSAYLAFLDRRNGSIDPTQAYPHREAWLASTLDWNAHYEGAQADLLERNYVRYDPATEASAAELALLAFVKVNAGEAYGVEVVSQKRHGKRNGGALFDRVERVISQEETYHTRILVGAARQFGLPAPSQAWRPPLALKVLIGTLAYSPKAIFHPILLASEIAGVFTFNWMLNRVGEVFAKAPALRDTMQARLSEILIDEIGHIAFNRMAVGPTGLAVARALAPHIAKATSDMTPEFQALGWDAHTTSQVASFDLAMLPEHVRREAFFV